MILSTKLKLLLAVVVGLAAFGMAQSSASAVTGTCWFTSVVGPVGSTGTCSAPGSYGQYGTNDILTGRSSTGAGKAIPNAVNTKAELITFIQNKFNSSNVHDSIGAAFLIQELRSNTDKAWPSAADVADWKALMQQTNVTIARTIDPTVGQTSYYDAVKRNVFYGAHPTVSREVIYIYQNGKIVAEIETGCGNLVARPVLIVKNQASIIPKSLVQGGGQGPATAITVTVGTKVTFSQTITSSSNNIAASDSFDWAVTSNTAQYSPASGSNRGIEYNNVNPLKLSRSTTFNTPGKYCVTIAVSGKPSYATGPSSAVACVTVVAAPTTWSLSGESRAVSGSTTGTAGGTITVAAGSSFYFTHTITNASTSSNTSAPITYATAKTAGPNVIPVQSQTNAPGLAPSRNIVVTSRSYTIPNNTPNGTRYCMNISFNPTSSAASGATTTEQACVIVGAPAPVCTGGSSTVPTRIQPGDTARITLSFNRSAAVQSLTYAITGVVASTTVSIAANQGSYTLPSVVMPNAAANYDATWTVSSVGGSCHGVISAVDMPYFSVYGAGVRAGGDFGGSCNGGGTLAAWRNFSGGNNYGAGSQLSAIAMIAIVGFASKDTVPASTNPVALTFANPAPSNSDNSPKLGGNYGGSYCLSNPKAPTTNVTDLAGATNFSVTGKNGAYKKTGNIQLDGGTLAIKQNTALFVTGNVYITSNINYAGSWNSQTDIPSFVVVATGNIYIDPLVTNLDGLYVAKPNGSNGGHIYTCGNATGPISASALYACNKQLVVHGSFVAKNIHLLRALGSLKDDASHSNAVCHNNGGIASNRPTCAAEVFDFSPEMYLSNPAIRPQGNGTLHYDSIITLPPIL